MMANIGVSYPIRLAVKGEATLSPAQIRQRVEANLRDFFSAATFPSIEVLYQKISDQLKCASSPGTDSYCLDATVSFFNISDPLDIPDTVIKAQNHITEALEACVPGYSVYLIPKYIPGAAPINPDLSEGNSPPNDITKQNVLLSKLIESKLGGRIGKFKTELSKEMVEMIETSGLLKPKM